MKRLALVSSAVAVLLTSCAATYPAVKSVSCTAPSEDNAETNCALAPILNPVSPGTPRQLRCEWWQGGAKIKTDSLTVAAGTVHTFPPPPITLWSEVQATVYVIDAGGTSCPATLKQTPYTVTRPPAKPVVAVVP
jgi:hypothetical protein